ncbi:MAG: metallophosphoesterase [Bacteroidaceae bacterium]|nr:metallophosphoesterase [Bacteroidaceae bacterium]
MALLLLPDAYIFPVYVRRWTKKWWVRMLYFLPALLLVCFMGAIMLANDMRPSVQPFVGIFMVSFLVVCVPKTLFALIDGFGRLFLVRGVRRVFRIIGMCLAFFSAIVLCYGYFFGRNHFVANEQTIYFADLPEAFDGYRIAQISDMHVGTFRNGHESDVAAIVDFVNAQKCDAILFTGDLVNHHPSELYGLEGELSRLSAPDGVYSVMGNHDYSMYMHYPSEDLRNADVEELKRCQRSFGWELLLDENRVLRRGTDSIAIVGVENCGRPPFPKLGDLAKATAGLGDGCFKILLSHDPTHWQSEVVPQTDIQLTLSGHTHAGQFSVFGWSPVKHVYDEWSGVYCNDEGQVLNISNGIGAVMFPFRFGAWPEVNVITLKRKE